MNTRREPENNRLERIGARVRQRALSGSEASAVGFTLVVYVFAGAGLGYWLDKNFETSYWIAIGTLLGTAVGFREMFRLTKKLTRKSALEENDELRQAEESAAQSTTSPVQTPSVIEQTAKKPPRPRLFSADIPPPPLASFEKKSKETSGTEPGPEDTSSEEAGR